MLDGVPWAVENGALTAAAVARAAHYASTRGAEGVTRPGDLKVSATPTASQSVRIATGSATILNRQAPGESYQGLARSDTDHPISVTGVARNDLLLARIVDPKFSPWQTSDVPDPINGPYFQPHVIQGVSASTTKASDVVSYSALALARIAVPASGNITNAMITPLRKLAQPRTWTDSQVQAGQNAAGGGAEILLSTHTTFRRWPLNTKQVQIPEWANWAQVSIQLVGVAATAAVVVETKVKLGALLGPVTYINYDGQGGGAGGGAEHMQHFAFAELDVTALQGTTVTLEMQARRTDSNASAQAWVGNGEQVVFTTHFQELVA